MARRFGLLWVVTAAALLSAPVGGQSPAEPGITIDFAAADRTGQPVGDLSAADVTLRVGGKVRPILNLERVGADIAGDIVLLVDEPTLFGLEPVAKDAIASLLKSRPDDRISYLSTRQAGRINHQPAHATVLAGAAAMHTGPGDLWTCMPDMLRAVENLAKTLPRGRTTAVVVLTRGMEEGGADRLPDRTIGCSVGRQDLRETQQLIAGTQIDLLFVAANHLERSWGLDTIAANTGGRSGLVTWKDTGALARLLETTRPFYRATIAPDPGPRTPQRVEIRTSRSGVRLMAPAVLDLRPPGAGLR